MCALAYTFTHTTCVHSPPTHPLTPAYSRLHTNKHTRIAQVTWLASWTENISDNIKYIMLNANSRMKGQNDLKKYEKARQLKVKQSKSPQCFFIVLPRNSYTHARPPGSALYARCCPFQQVVHVLDCRHVRSFSLIVSPHSSVQPL